MTDANTKREGAIVPIGKYKGQPIEVLAADKEYAAWLCAQVWFREKFPALHQTIVFNNVEPPRDTPEHNELVMRFVDDAELLFGAIYGPLPEQLSASVQLPYTGQEMWRELRYIYSAIDLRKHPAAKIEGLDAALAHGDVEASSSLRALSSEYEVFLGADSLGTYATEDTARTAASAAVRAAHAGASRAVAVELGRQEVEPRGGGDLRVRLQLKWDPARFKPQPMTIVLRRRHEVLTKSTYDAATRLYCEALPIAGLEVSVEVRAEVADSIGLSEMWIHSARLEFKPLIGDDFPSVIRQAKASECDLVVAERVEPTNLSLDKVKRAFQLAGLRLVTTAEAAAARDANRLPRALRFKEGSHD